ncbi:IS1634 family transposase [Thiomonas sp. FB-Cd]|uniref:IS1634 family transposase n=1 Tax=Thiomonas sp. FB-Cd TaxID=1158292 RepID=UPI0004DEFC9D|nr:IS1634 family transposase [Thiomonas sp. FB-Cd]
MFIKITQSGGRRYAQLVESFRNDAGQPRQRTVCTLGRLDVGGDVDKLIAGLQRAQGRAPAASSLQGLRFLASRQAGDVWALAQLWKQLELDELAGAWRRSKTEVDVLGCLRAMVWNRLSDAQSKLGVLRWLDTVALPVEFAFSQAPQHQHLLRAMDVIDEHAGALGERLSMLLRPLVDQDLSVVFYDLTTVSVAGESELPGDVRVHGMGKSGKVERQFMLSLVQTADGLPIAHEVHPGNTAEARTLLPMIRALLARYPLKRVVLIADRGLLSLDNLKELGALQDALRTEGRDVEVQYILAVPAARYGEFADDLRTLAATQDSTKPWAAQLPWKQQRLVVAHDPEGAARRRQQREEQLAELIALGQQWSGTLDAQDAGERRRGRPLSDSGATARFYHAVKEANMAHVVKVDLQGKLFSFQIDEARKQYLQLLDGKLLLVTNTDAPADEVVQRYKSLADIERGFRVLKSDIAIGPVYHRLPRRIRAHALICFIALILHRVMRMRLRAAGREGSPTRWLEQLRAIHQQTVQSADGETATGLTEITPAQKALFADLSLPTPIPADLPAPVL